MMLGSRNPIADMTDIGPSLTKFAVKKTSYYKDHTHTYVCSYNQQLVIGRNLSFVSTQNRRTNLVLANRKGNSQGKLSEGRVLRGS